MIAFNIWVKKGWATPRLVSFRGLIQNFRQASPPLSHGSPSPGESQARKLRCKKEFNTGGFKPPHCCLPSQLPRTKNELCLILLLWLTFLLIAVMCPPLPIQSEGLIITSPTCEKPGAELDYATECRFTCKNGYRLNGPRLKTCNQNKNWIPVGNPSCIGAFSSFFIRDLKIP